MPSKFDRLRSGEVVEIEPGRKGRLDLQKKTFETSDGRTMYVGDDPDFFPNNEEGIKYSREKEALERDIKKSPLGEFGYQFGNQGIAGAAKKWVNKLIQKGGDHERTLRVHQDVGEKISQRSPYISAAATAASFVPDIALTKGMSGVKAAPTLAALHAGPRLIEEPGQVAGEAALGAAGGFLIDKGASALNRIAQRRGQIRALPGQQAAVEEANRAQTQGFNALRQDVRGVNEARLKQHEADLLSRQNRMTEAQNAYQQAKTARETEIVKLKNEAELAKAQRSANASQLEEQYKSAKAATDVENKRLSDEFKQAQAQYHESLKTLPELQKQAQAEFSANVVKNAKEIEKSFPKAARISSEDLGVSNFIDQNISKSGIAGTTEARQAARVLNSIFPEGEIIGGRELSKRYKALEDAIQRSTPEVQTVLNDFKKSMGKSLPSLLEESIAYNKVMPLIKKTIESDIKSVMGEIEFLGKGAVVSKNLVTKSALANATRSLKEGATPKNFVAKLQNGELARELATKIATVEDFLIDIRPEDIPGLKKTGLLEAVSKEAKRKHEFFVDQLTNRLQTKLAKYEIKAMESARNSSKKLSKDVKKTFGMAEPVSPPPAPMAPNPVPSPNAPQELPPVPPISMPPPVAPPQTPPIPQRPNLTPEPMAPNPIPSPTLSPAQGMSERAGDFLEAPLLSGGGKGVMNSPLTKLAGLKYLMGKAALPAEAAYLGMKGLTSPTGAGEMARMTFKQGGIQAIDTWAQRYPSYRNGILDNPQERRSLTKEVEDDAEIPIEQKAIIQSKINRGKPLQARL